MALQDASWSIWLEVETNGDFLDNQSCIKFVENLVFHDQSKYIEIGYHFIRDCVQRGVVKLENISTDE